MLYLYDDIKELLSKTAQTSLAVDTRYIDIAEAVTDFIIAKTGYTSSELLSLGWSKSAFVFLLEYFVYNRAENITTEFQNKADTHYKNAMALLDANQKSVTTSKLGSMEGLYDQEF